MRGAAVCHWLSEFSRRCGELLLAAVCHWLSEFSRRCGELLRAAVCHWLSSAGVVVSCFALSRSTIFTDVIIITHTALCPVTIYELTPLYSINIEIHLSIPKKEKKREEDEERGNKTKQVEKSASITYIYININMTIKIVLCRSVKPECVYIYMSDVSLSETGRKTRWTPCSGQFFTESEGSGNLGTVLWPAGYRTQVDSR